MKLWFDIDDVIHDFVGTIIPHLNAHTGKRIGMERVDNWIMEDVWGVSTETFKEIIRKSGVYSENPFYEGVRPMFEEFRADGHEVHLVTSRFSFSDLDTEKETVRWLERHRIHYDSIHFTSEKGKVCSKLGLDCFMDDSIANIHKIMRDSPGTVPLIRSRNWNGEVEMERLVSVWAISRNDVAKLRTVKRMGHVSDLRNSLHEHAVGNR